MLTRAAAARWKVAPADCRAEKGFVVHGTKKLSLRRGWPRRPRSSPPAESRAQGPRSRGGSSASRRSGSTPLEKVTGKAQFGLDVRLPGMLVAVVARPPVFGGTVKSFSADEGLKVPGVKKVVPYRRGVAVVGERFWAAQAGARRARGRLGRRASARARLASGLRESYRRSPARGGGAAAVTARRRRRGPREGRGPRRGRIRGPVPGPRRRWSR